MIRKARKKDIKQILSILEKAKDKLKNEGINQWQDGYPNQSILEDDIKKNQLYVYEKDDSILAFAAIVEEKDPNYDSLIGGKWLSKTYMTLHRIAVDASLYGSGIGGALLDYAYEKASEYGKDALRVDTHKDNMAMNALILSRAFEKRGELTLLRDLSKRTGYEKMTHRDIGLYYIPFDDLTNRDLYEEMRLREAVFILEQECLYPDFDDKDYGSIHILAKKNGKIIGTMRIMPEGLVCEYTAFGRFALDKDYRKHGYGRIVFTEAIDYVKNVMKSNHIHIAAQSYLVNFYKSLGFYETSDTFISALRKHTLMDIDL